MSALTAGSLAATLQKVEAGSFATEVERAQARDALFAALRRVQTPWDMAMSHTWIEPAMTAIIKVLIDAGFWKAWVAAGGKPDTSAALAKLTGFDAVLLQRYLRALAGQLYVLEVAKDTWALTPFSRALAEDKFPSLYTFLYEMNQPCFANYPKYAAETKYSSATDAEYNNFHSWKGRDQTMFTMLSAKPEIGPHVMNTMTTYSAAKTPWVDVYPTEKIIAGANLNAPLVIDVGGGNGHDLDKFRALHPTVPQGSLIVQDLPTVVRDTKVQPPCIAQGYDFFTPQPVKGARIYYLHLILHDWPDVKAIEILQNIAGAMEKGYSKILIHETVIASEKAHPRTTLSDIVMLMSLGALERTEDMWSDLVAKAGLRLAKIWTSPESVESILELELP